ncbi:response regulator [Alsobacter sp. SYSU M60028]|uniref:histidine kinase n=1 Tax=Alsobacter ponti TaxID=2962936 RepID=A0ABT1L7S3_9HYPH|nr:response regulator [Alsobacter ponti]MCP8937525.1 response regulator [Alsobacter ponti]
MPHSRLVLNVDDTEAARYAKTRTLQRAGYEVIEAETGAAALKLVAERQPGVVVLDVKLPDISGIEVCKRIKHDFPGVLVLQISAAFVASKDRVQGLESGADVYMTQPSDSAELTATVHALYRLREAELELRRVNESLEQRVAERTAELARMNEALRREMQERMRAEAALVQSQKMEAVGQLTGGIAHDFNNLLAAIVGGLNLIERRTREPQVIEITTHALNAAKRGVKLISQLLAFSRTQDLDAHAVDANELIEGMQSLLRQSIGPSVSIATDLMPGAAVVMVDPTQLELAIVNLVINARDALGGSGHITLRTQPDPHHAGGFIDVSVIDDGPGMSEAVKAKAFDPFFTTKPPGQGTGLGLSQVYGMARQLGGEATIESAVGQGTTVRIMLPVAHTPADRPAPDVQVEQRGRNETVLLVEDDVDLRSILTDMLRELGYGVLVASDGAEALTLAGRHAFDLALLDFAMPGMTGAETARELKRLHPRLPILFASGHANTQELAGIGSASKLLRKPFETAELARRLREELGRPLPAS